MKKEKQIKNKIIALSGQPVSGKGTNSKVLVEKFKNKGYKEENIHIVSTGEEFRKFFNIIKDFIKNSEDPMKQVELGNTSEMQCILKNPEYRAAFIKSALQLEIKKIDISNLSVEEANNLDELKPIRRVIDTIIDTKIEALGKEINKEEHPNDVWIIDSRLAFYNIPEAFSVRLTTTPEVAGKRLFEDKSRGEEDSEYETIEEAIEAREKRRIGEQKRYKERYGVDLEDESNYDLIIDTSYLNCNDISETILKCLDCYMQNKSFEKNFNVHTGEER